MDVRETDKSARRSLYRVAAIVGGAITAAPLLGFLLMFLIRRNSEIFLFSATLTILALPGEYFAAVILGQGHGPSILGTLFLGTPLNFLFYASLCFAFLLALKR